MAKTKKKTKVKKNHVIFMLDASGSMSGLTRKTSEVYSNLVNELKAKSKKFNQPTTVSLYDFDTNLVTHYEDLNIKDVPSLNNYRARGSTALLDAFGQVATKVDINHNYNADDSVLVFVLTDGEENASRNFSISTITSLISRLQATDVWTITFQVPPGSSRRLQQYGIPAGNISEWEASELGLSEVEEKTSGGLDSYYLSRSVGKTSVQSFYSNAAHIPLAKVQKVLVDVSKDFLAFSISCDTPIKDFIEKNAKKQYVKGEGFYQLMKPEIVQKNKEILIYDKKHRKLYYGDAARNLIGLPVGTDIKVIPGNHGQYEIFVESTSVNRKLKAGTKLLVKK